jgi:hypothetical protein
MYGKSSIPKSKLLGKEFTKGIVAKVVKGISVSWANFGHEINQQRKWQSKLNILIAKKASLLGLNMCMWEVKMKQKVIDIVKVEKGVKT